MKVRLDLVLLLAGLAGAQTAVDMASEPHHSLLLQNSQVRVFNVSLNLGEKAFVRHEHNFLMITLEDCELVMWPEGKSDIQNFRFGQGEVRFFLGGPAIGLRNDRTHGCRNVIVEFLDPKVTSYGYQWESGGWDYGSGGINPPVDPHAGFRNSMRLGRATASDVQLLPGDALPLPEQPSGELLIPVTAMDLKAGESKRFGGSPGEALWISPGRKEKLINSAGEATRFAVVEFPAGEHDK
jgi:hypothetical protein